MSEYNLSLSIKGAPFIMLSKNIFRVDLRASSLDTAGAPILAEIRVPVNVPLQLESSTTTYPLVMVVVNYVSTNIASDG